MRFERQIQPLVSARTGRSSGRSRGSDAPGAPGLTRPGSSVPRSGPRCGGRPGLRRDRRGTTATATATTRGCSSTRAERYAARLASAAQAVGCALALGVARRPDDRSSTGPSASPRVRGRIAPRGGRSRGRGGGRSSDEAAGRGALPHLDALRQRGVLSVGIRPPFPARRARGPGHPVDRRLAGSPTVIVGDGAPREPTAPCWRRAVGDRSTALSGRAALGHSRPEKGVPTVVVGVLPGLPVLWAVPRRRSGSETTSGATSILFASRSRAGSRPRS